MEIINLGSLILNNYFIKTDLGIIVIDTGYAGNFENFCKKLQKNNIKLEEIKFILLTHAHDDHAGFLNELINATNAVVLVDELAPKRLLAGHNQWIGGCSGKLAKIFVSAMGLIGNSKHEFPAVTLPANSIIWDRKSQPLIDKSIPIRIISLPGHTADSVGFLTNCGKLFCGDAAMNNFPSIHRNIIWIENLDDYKKSWDVMINSEATVIYPGHGSPFPKNDLIKYKKHLNTLVIQK